MSPTTTPPETPSPEPPAPRPEKLPAVERIGRLRRAIRDIMRWSRPHWKVFAAAAIFMSLSGLFSVGRIVLALPVLARLGLADVAAAPEMEGVGAKEKKSAELLQEEADSTVGRVMEDIVQAMNSVTGAWVPDAWTEPDDGSLDQAARARWRAEQLDRYATLYSTLILFAFATLVMCAATYGDTYVSYILQMRIGMDVREAVCRKVLDQPLAFFEEGKRGDLFQRALNDTTGYARGLAMVLGSARAILQVLSSLVILIGVSPLLSLVIFLGVPFLLPMRKLGMRTLKRSHRRQQKATEFVETLHQNLSGARTVKAFGSEERRVKELRATDERLTYSALKVQRAKSTSLSLMAFINNVLAIGLVLGGGWLIMRGHLDVGVPALLVFMLVLVNMYQPIKTAVKHVNNLLDAMASIERTTQVLDLPPGMPDRPDAIPFPGVRESIRFERVSFSYVDGTPVLHDVSFEIPRGGTVAVVGPSGAGKSTLCDLLLRFYDPNDGRISVDGTDIRAYQRATYLSRTACVTQTPFLFHTTIRENIREGNHHATDEQIQAAAKAAYIHDHIMSQPGGYDEAAGEGGARMSGGQRQRITIARALVRDPDILVLDEATSSLDTASEQAVQRALERLREGRTTLVVAHRLSTIRDADCIIVMNDGRVVEQGSHNELIAAEGLYAQLVRLQDVSARPA